jgi:hypothetical protein
MDKQSIIKSSRANARATLLAVWPAQIAWLAMTLFKSSPHGDADDFIIRQQRF